MGHINMDRAKFPSAFWINILKQDKPSTGHEGTANDISFRHNNITRFWHLYTKYSRTLISYT